MTGMLSGMPETSRQAGRCIGAGRRAGTLPTMDVWDLDELEKARTESGRLYHEFISVPDLSGGLYVLEAGATDPQSPHTEDELYVVMSGRARVMVGGEVRPIREGSVVFVAADVEHRFFDIEERLVLLVMFGPAEYSRRAS
jgi:mannose-6-phosphate isomerase-like protein (cupin superfamily)